MSTSMLLDRSASSEETGEIPYVPIFLDLRGRKVVLLGGNAMAAAKARLLIRGQASVLVVAESLDHDMAELAVSGRVERQAGPFATSMLDGAALVIDASGDPDLTPLVRKAAEARRVPLNVVDRPEDCDFIVPALLERGPITIAVSTGGAAPALARSVRQQLETAIPEAYGRLARAAQRCREEVKGRLLGSRARQRFWDRVLSSKMAAELSSGDEATIVADIQAELARFVDGEEAVGSVVLVGAGPGDPELLTLKAVRAIEGADIIFHDALVPDAILRIARREARLVSVGKRAGQPSIDQALTNRMMMVAARRGDRVVRLKGGDPLVFGRGGEEAAYLREHGVAVSIVPGVTAAAGIAAELQLPLTHRGLARSIRLITAHCRSAEETDRIDWRSLADPSTTLAVYMGRGQAGRIAGALIAAGMPATTPTVAVENGTTPDNRHRFAPLRDLGCAVGALDAGSPVLIIIGAAVAEAPGWPSVRKPDERLEMAG